MITPAAIEEECFRRFGHTLECERLCIVDQYRVLDHDAPVPHELLRMATLKGLPAVSQGAAGIAVADEYQKALPTSPGSSRRWT